MLKTNKIHDGLASCMNQFSHHSTAYIAAREKCQYYPKPQYLNGSGIIVPCTFNFRINLKYTILSLMRSL